MLIAGRTHKEWREDNRETLLHSKKEYYEKSKEHHSETRKTWREANEDYIKAYKATTITCECGCIVTRSDLSKHKEVLNIKN